MSFGDLKAEIVAIGIAIVGAVGAVVRFVVGDRALIEKRLDALERTYLTRDEFQRFVKEVHDHNERHQEQITSELKEIHKLLWEITRRPGPHE